MKPSSIKLGVFLCLAALNLCCAAQTSLLNGSWKIDPSTKKYDAPNFTMTADANGFSMAAPGRAVDKTVCDGQPKPDPSGSTITCRKAESAYIIDTVKPESHTTVSTSPDGNTLTYHAEGAGTDGVHYTLVLTSKRISGGPGIAGVWHPTGFDLSPDTGIVTIEIAGDTLLFKESNEDKSTSYKLDGTEVKRPFGQTASATLVDPHTLKVTYRSNAKVNSENTFALSDDGKTLTETDITPEPNRSTFSVVYHKP